jgi:hypothetical protein
MAPAQRLARELRRLVDRASGRADSSHQKSSDLGAAQRRQLHALVGRVPRLIGTAFHLSGLPHGTRSAQWALPGTRLRTGLVWHNRRCLGLASARDSLAADGLVAPQALGLAAQRACGTTGLGTGWHNGHSAPRALHQNDTSSRRSTARCSHSPPAQRPRLQRRRLLERESSRADTRCQNGYDLAQRQAPSAGSRGWAAHREERLAMYCGYPSIRRASSLLMTLMTFSPDRN